MTTSWLNGKLAKLNGITTDGGNPVLLMKFSDRAERVYCPNATEYKVTAEVVHKAHELGATIIAYGDSWGDSTYEAKEYAKELNITVMPFRSLFAYLRRYGVS